MADYKEFYEARKEIIDIVKKDLIGPVYEDEISIPLSYPINTNFIIVEIYHE